MAERKKLPRKAKGGAVAPAAGSDRLPEGWTDGAIGGRFASEIDARDVSWLLYPWVPKGMLTLVVGDACVGKSTFIAALIAYTTGAQILEERVKRPKGRVVFLPGYEEDPGVMTIPRLRGAGANLDHIMILDRGHIELVKDRDRLTKLVIDLAADLLIGDPIDSYVDAGLQENNGQDVRPLLEAAAAIGTATGAAVVFARHPGKDRENIMPGSRHWKNVPRSILQLTTDGGAPPQQLLSHYKDSLGTNSTPRHYTLDRQGSGAPRFLLGEEVDRSAEDLSRAAAGLTGRYKLMAACKLIRWLFKPGDSPTRKQLGEEGRLQGLGEDTINEALRLLGVRSVPPGERGLPWLLHRTQAEWPSWVPVPESPSQGGSSPEM